MAHRGSVIRLVATLGAAALLVAACTSARRHVQPPTAQEPAPPVVTLLPQTATPTTQAPNAPPAAQPEVAPAAQANPRKARQAATLVDAAKRYYAKTNCYPQMSSGGKGMPAELKTFLDQVPWPSGFIYETQTRAMGWQMGAGAVYYIDIYYPGDTPAWNGQGSGRVYIVYNEQVRTC